MFSALESRTAGSALFTRLSTVRVAARRLGSVPSLAEVTQLVLSSDSEKPPSLMSCSNHDPHLVFAHCFLQHKSAWVTRRNLITLYKHSVFYPELTPHHLQAVTVIQLNLYESSLDIRHDAAPAT